MKRKIKQASRELSELRINTSYLQELAKAGILEKGKVDDYVQLCQNFETVARPVTHCEARQAYNKKVDRVINRIGLGFLGACGVAGAVATTKYQSHLTMQEYGRALNVAEYLFFGLGGVIFGGIGGLFGFPLTTDKIKSKIQKTNPREFAKDYDNSVDALMGYSHEITRQSDALMRDLERHNVGEVTQKVEFSQFSGAYASLRANKQLEGKVWENAVGGLK
jgi:hypothetical protein